MPEYVLKGSDKFVQWFMFLRIKDKGKSPKCDNSDNKKNCLKIYLATVIVEFVWWFVRVWTDGRLRCEIWWNNIRTVSLTQCSTCFFFFSRISLPHTLNTRILPAQAKLDTKRSFLQSRKPEITPLPFCVALDTVLVGWNLPHHILHGCNDQSEPHDMSSCTANGAFELLMQNGMF
jgi:hypothetical protein